MSGTIPPLPQYAFMTWFSVKAQGQLFTVYKFVCNFGILKMILTNQRLLCVKWTEKIITNGDCVKIYTVLKSNSNNIYRSQRNR
jgi:hypothetical protein